MSPILNMCVFYMHNYKEKLIFSFNFLDCGFIKLIHLMDFVKLYFPNKCLYLSTNIL